MRRRRSWIMLPCAAILAMLSACSDDDDTTYYSSHSYKGHETDVDSNNLVNVYPAVIGTRLDDCQTCHTGGTFTIDDDGEIVEVFKNACDFCHLIQHPDSSLIEAQPTTYAETLNPFGADYLAAGRSRQALQDIAGEDSDEDGYSNADEIADLKYPGDPLSMPGQQVAPMRIFSMEEVTAMPSHSEFLLCNSSRQEFDNYATYEGVKIVDLLEAAGVDLSSPEIVGITVIAPDGFMKDFDLDEIINPYPAGLFFAGLDTDTLGTECGFVQYPDVMPEGLTDGGEIPGEQWLLLAYLREGLEMEASWLDITSGKINGEGPFRIIVPQSEPGSPDRGATSTAECNDGFEYVREKDHNAGDMVRGVVAIRVNPLPAGYEDFDYRYGGWAYIDAQQVIVYGHGVE